MARTNITPTAIKARPPLQRGGIQRPHDNKVGNLHQVVDAPAAEFDRIENDLGAIEPESLRGKAKVALAAGRAVRRAQISMVEKLEDGLRFVPSVAESERRDIAATIDVAGGYKDKELAVSAEASRREANRLNALKADLAKTLGPKVGPIAETWAEAMRAFSSAMELEKQQGRWLPRLTGDQLRQVDAELTELEATDDGFENAAARYQLLCDADDVDLVSERVLFLASNEVVRNQGRSLNRVAGRSRAGRVLPETSFQAGIADKRVSYAMGVLALIRHRYAPPVGVAAAERVFRELSGLFDLLCGLHGKFMNAAEYHRRMAVAGQGATFVIDDRWIWRAHWSTPGADGKFPR